MATYTHLQNLPVRNDDSRPLTVVIEPWAEEIVLAPGQEVLLSFEGPTGGEVEVEDKPGLKVLYGWPGSTFSVGSSRAGQDGHATRADFD